ncbi:hypothetical protein CQ14_41305 [Bradyrhizobium lablabi]|uniref:Uncharacterized protein n=1 Tax=Bradyrhizobium lablabi TaxID=722472 RepID=A0A0R3N811_9BRAD|nr:hypothetical protein CQ14_41305 [Bradyrhizobium lablabi]
MATSAEIIPQSTKCLSIKLNRLRLWVFLSRILSNRPIDKVPVFGRQMWIMVAVRAPTGDGSGVSLACLGQVLLKALLPGLARLRLFGGGVLHLRPSWYIKWVKIVRVHASLTL